MFTILEVITTGCIHIKYISYLTTSSKRPLYLVKLKLSSPLEELYIISLSRSDRSATEVTIFSAKEDKIIAHS